MCFIYHHIAHFSYFYSGRKQVFSQWNVTFVLFLLVNNIQKHCLLHLVKNSKPSIDYHVTITIAKQIIEIYFGLCIYFLNVVLIIVISEYTKVHYKLVSSLLIMEVNLYYKVMFLNNLEWF